MGKYWIWFFCLITVCSAATGFKPAAKYSLIGSDSLIIYRDSVLMWRHANEFRSDIGAMSDTIDSLNACHKSDSAKISANSWKLQGKDTIAIFAHDSTGHGAIKQSIIDTASQLRMTINGKEPTITGSTADKFWNGLKQFVSITTNVISNFASDVRNLFSGSDAISYNSSTGVISHQTADGYHHVPATGTTHNGQFLRSGATAGSEAWYQLTKSDVGLGNVDNTSDLNKPISTATQTALNGKENSLGNPSTDGYLLSSTAAGTRSWVAPYSHPTYSVSSPTLTGANVLATLTLNNLGHVTGVSTRTLTPSDISAVAANNAITAGTACKITYDSKGLVTAGTSLSASDIPGLDWSKITTGKPTTLAGYGITDPLVTDKNNLDWNTLTSSCINTSITNSPDGGSTTFMGLNAQHYINSNYQFQIAGRNDKFAVRTKDNGTWQPWRWLNTGTGTTNALTKFTNGSTGQIGSSIISDDNNYATINGGVIGTNGDTRYNLKLIDNTAYAQGVGSGIVFEGKCNSAGDQYDLGGIKAYKVNGTDGDYSGQLHFQTRKNGSTPATAMILDENKNAIFKAGIGINTVPANGLIEIKPTTIDANNGIALYTGSGTTARAYLKSDGASDYNWYLTRGGNDTYGIVIDKNGNINIPQALTRAGYTVWDAGNMPLSYNGTTISIPKNTSITPTNGGTLNFTGNSVSGYYEVYALTPGTNTGLKIGQTNGTQASFMVSGGLKYLDVTADYIRRNSYTVWDAGNFDPKNFTGHFINNDGSNPIIIGNTGNSAYLSLGTQKRFFLCTGLNSSGPHIAGVNQYNRYLSLSSEGADLSVSPSDTVGGYVSILGRNIHIGDTSTVDYTTKTSLRGIIKYPPNNITMGTYTLTPTTSHYHVTGTSVGNANITLGTSGVPDGMIVYFTRGEGAQNSTWKINNIEFSFKRIMTWMYSSSEGWVYQ